LTAAGPHLFWITSRAAGIAALILSSGSLGVGVLIRGRGEPRRLLGSDARALHEALSLATIVAIAVHGLALLGDSYLHPTPLDIAIPFSGGYRPFWTGIGIVGGWGLAALGLSYYARGRIGQARWRYLHRFIPIFWALGVVHTLGAGTDAEQPWLLIAIALPTVPALLLLLGRLAGSPAEPRQAPAPRPPTPQPQLSGRRS
jgi:methionine sulfoxide reductase heme-binding subunit